MWPSVSRIISAMWLLAIILLRSQLATQRQPKVKERQFVSPSLIKMGEKIQIYQSLNHRNVHNESGNERKKKIGNVSYLPQGVLEVSENFHLFSVIPAA